MIRRRRTNEQPTAARWRRWRAVLSLVLLTFAVMFGRVLFLGRSTSAHAHSTSERVQATHEGQSRCTKARATFHHTRHGAVPSFRNDDDDDDDDDSDDVLVATNYWEELAHPQRLVPSIGTSLATGFATSPRLRERIAPSIAIVVHEARGPPGRASA